MIEGVVDLGYSQLENLGYGVLFPDEDTTNMEMFKQARHDPNRDTEVLRGKGAFVDAKVLYVDEVQDLTPLQWRWYLLQKLAVEKVFIGGDDDQTIYGWAGANPDFMLNEEGEFEVLEKTYRIPREIWGTCDQVIQHVDHRQPKTVNPHGDGGEVVTIKRPSARQLMEYLRDGDCMVLFRARYQIDEFRNDLHEYGIPYRNMSTYDTWSEDVVKLRDALAKIDTKEGSIKGDELEILIEYAEDHMVNDDNGSDKTEAVMGQLGGISFDRLNEIFDLKVYGSDPTFKASTYLRETEEINYYEKQAIVGCLNAGNYDMDPDRVRIGTIHSAKGKEAETVLLSTDSTKTILENMDAGHAADGGATGSTPTVPQSPSGISDAERRVYYVGMTRASEKLILAEGVTDPECVIPIDALLGQGGRKNTTQGGQGSFDVSW
jgi:DNA helicase-2/ATP-dependent DNA helicase PcrA